ncbi:MAG: bile acid:sodium symporter family protein [Planctomycetales bacterium]|nr:bile acid:sodium symporter family protein [Planctomycetales bacterium]
MLSIDQLRCGLLAVSGVFLLIAIFGVATQAAEIWRPSIALFLVTLPCAVGAIPKLRGFQFTCWIVSAFVLGMIFSERFQAIGDLDLRHPWLILGVVQLVMFGMGTQMRVADIAGVAKAPHAVCIGLLCQFTIMPVLGITLAKAVGLPNEIAAGVVLIGSCSSGLASNVMVYMAKGNLPLSVTLTTIATLLAPLVTPLWMKLLAGEFIEVSFVSMMINITKIVVVPIGAAFVHDVLTNVNEKAGRVIAVTAAVGLFWILTLVAWHVRIGLPESSSQWLVLSGFVCGAIAFGVAYHRVVIVWPGLAKAMPVLSMCGIVYFTLVTTAAGREALIDVGVWLLMVAVLHNLLGYCFGYGLSRALGLDASTARTVALEVGLQNGGMASGLAGAMGKLGTVGLAAAIFSPWMNVSGSVLANYWRARPIAFASED